MATKSKREHRTIPVLKLKKLWLEGKTYVQMAKAIDRYDGKSADPTKPTRAIISRMLNVGFVNPETEKHEVLKTREGMRAIGVGAKAPKAPKAAKVAKVSVTKGKPGRKAVLGKTVLIQMAEDGKHVRVEVDKPKGALVNFEKFLPSLINVLHGAGYEVVKSATPPAAAPAAEAAPEATQGATPPPPPTSAPTTEVAA